VPLRDEGLYIVPADYHAGPTADSCSAIPIKAIHEDESADGRVRRKLLAYEALYLFFLEVITQADHRGSLPVSTTGQQDIIGTGGCVRSAQRKI
jgi:hypothetical protein